MSKQKRMPAPDLSYIAEELRQFAVPIGSLTTDPKNARLHGEANRASTRASLVERGQTLPITVRLANSVVMTGNSTLEIARELGWLHIAATFRDYDEAQAAAWAIAHNRTAELATWDYRQLAETIAESPDSNWIDVGFEANELEAIMAHARTQSEAPDAPAENDPATQWEGMPEFDQKDKTAFRSLTVHFKDQSCVDAFFAKIGHAFTEKTRYIWYPEIEIETYADKVYESD
jgi:hypothetical protein